MPAFIGVEWCGRSPPGSLRKRWMRPWGSGVGRDPAHRTGDRQLRPKPDGGDGDPSHRGKKRQSATNMHRYWIGDVALRCTNATNFDSRHQSKSDPQGVGL